MKGVERQQQRARPLGVMDAHPWLIQAGRSGPGQVAQPVPGLIGPEFGQIGAVATESGEVHTCDRPRFGRLQQAVQPEWRGENPHAFLLGELHFGEQVAARPAGPHPECPDIM